MTNGPFFWFILKTKVVDTGLKVLNQLKNPKSQTNCPRHIQFTESRSCPLILTGSIHPKNAEITLFKGHFS